MDGFSYVMTLVAIIIGLSITHILSGIGQAIHRLRGHGAPIRIESVYLLWVGTVFINIISFWWWEYKFNEIVSEWSFALYVFILMYAIMWYLTAAILVPSKMDEISDSFEYFLQGRKWFFSLMLLIIVVDVIDSFLKGTAWGLRPIFIAQTIIFIASYTTGMVSTSRKAQLTSALTAFIANLFYMFIEMAKLGGW